MNPTEPPATDSFRYFVIGVLCVAVLLGVYFVRLNARVDRERVEATERLALCGQVERIASAASSNSLELRDTCRQLNGQSSNSVTPR
jgi:uncharacterized membrane protein (DUF106 family)